MLFLVPAREMPIFTDIFEPLYTIIFTQFIQVQLCIFVTKTINIGFMLLC